MNKHFKNFFKDCKILVKVCAIPFSWLDILKDKLIIKFQVNAKWRRNIFGLCALLGLVVIGGSYHMLKTHIAHDEFQQELEDDPALRAEIAQQKHDKHFIKVLAKPAVKDYHTYHRVIPSITIAQGIVESNWGNSDLYTKDHNAFGIKGKFYGKYANLQTNEFVNGREITEKSKFKKYPNLQLSVRDHNYLLQKLFIKKQNVRDPKKDAKLLVKNHYATDPDYSKKLIGTIKKNNLTKYDHE